MKRWGASFLAALMVAACLMGGCATYQRPFEVKPAHPGLRSLSYDKLKTLPEPEKPLIVAVYRFRDQTGQYKPSERASTFSTAVTQGATSILIRALEESGWFRPIEREGLSNLLNERQIIQQTRAIRGEGDEEGAPQLPALLFAGLLLEGGIIGYDTNVLTGGGGVRYFGVGGSGQYRQDQVTVYLRAVSTTKGEVLKTVHTTKTIISQKVDGGAFLFVDQNRLLETEVGYSFNEPPVLAVTEAINEAVRSLIVEGAREGLWRPANEADLGSEAFREYDATVAQAARTDYFGRTRSFDNRPGIGIGASAGLTRYHGDYREPRINPAGELLLRGNVAPRWGLGLAAAVGRIEAEGALDATAISAEGHVLYYFVPYSPVTPFLQVGGGALRRELDQFEQTKTDILPYATGAVGLEYMARPHLALNASIGTRYALGDDLDGASIGRIHDSVWGVNAGLVYYLGR